MLKTYLLLVTDGERRVLVQKLYSWLARTRPIEEYTETRNAFSSNIKKAIMAKGQLFRDIA